MPGGGCGREGEACCGKDWGGVVMLPDVGPCCRSWFKGEVFSLSTIQRNYKETILPSQSIA